MDRAMQRGRHRGRPEGAIDIPSTYESDEAYANAKGKRRGGAAVAFATSPFFSWTSFKTWAWRVLCVVLPLFLLFQYTHFGATLSSRMISSFSANDYLKISYNNVNRLIGMPRGSLSGFGKTHLTLPALTDTVRSAFSIAEDNPIHFHYIDAGGDVISVIDDADLDAYVTVAAHARRGEHNFGVKLIAAHFAAHEHAGGGSAMLQRLHAADDIGAGLHPLAARHGIQLKKKHATRLVSTFRCDWPIRVLYLITSQPKDFARRQSIRMSWGADPAVTPRWRTVFSVGVVDDPVVMDWLHRESEHMKDIIMTDVKEDFFNLTVKLQAAYEWVAKYCPTADFVAHADDDVFSNPHNVLHFLDEQPQSMLYTGVHMGRANVIRPNDTDRGVAMKYGVSWQEYPDDYYPDYCSGGFYILSMDLVMRFAQFFDEGQVDLVTPLKIDDAYVGVLVKMAGGKVKVINKQLFNHWTAGCHMHPDALSMHPAPENCMRHLWMLHLSRANGKIYNENARLCLDYTGEMAPGAKLRGAHCQWKKHDQQTWVHLPDSTLAIGSVVTGQMLCVSIGSVDQLVLGPCTSTATKFTVLDGGLFQRIGRRDCMGMIRDQDGHWAARMLKCKMDDETQQMDFPAEMPCTYQQDRDLVCPMVPKFCEDKGNAVAEDAVECCSICFKTPSCSIGVFFDGMCYLKSGVVPNATQVPISEQGKVHTGRVLVELPILEAPPILHGVAAMRAENAKQS